MKNPRVLLNSLLIIFLTSFYNCFSSQTKQNDLNDFNINWIVDNYIDFYSKRIKNFNSKEKYLMMSISNDIENKQTYIYLYDGCYDCPGVENSDYLILLYRGYRIVIATDNSKNKDIVLKKFKKTSIGTHFKVIPYNVNSTYNYARKWEIIYDKGKLIFFCNSILPELEETKKTLEIDNTVADCDPRKQ